MKLPLAITALSLLLCACTPAKDPSRLQVATTFYPLTFLAQQIGGDAVDVIQITPGGVEPHDFEPSAKQIAGIHNADVFLLHGRGIDPWADNVQRDLEQAGKVTLRMTDALSIKSTDPHVWLDPIQMQEEVILIRDALIKADPLQSQTFRENADVLIANLSLLDANFRKGLGSCAKRKVIVSHDAFSHLAQRYGFEPLSIAGLSPEEEPSPKRLAELSDLAEEQDIGTVFFETLVSKKLAQTIANEIGAQSLVLNPLEGLTSNEVHEGKTYFSVMEENLANLRIAMECL